MKILQDVALVEPHLADFEGDWTVRSRRAGVTDKSRVLVVSGAGAVIGVLAGFLFCATQGRALLQRIEAGS